MDVVENLEVQLRAIQEAAIDLEKALNACPHCVKVNVAIRHSLGNEDVKVNVFAEIPL